MIVSSLVASVVAPLLAGIEGTVRVVAKVAGDTGQEVVHTAEVAGNQEDPRQHRCRDRDHDEHRLS